MHSCHLEIGSPTVTHEPGLSTRMKIAGLFSPEYPNDSGTRLLTFEKPRAMTFYQRVQDKRGCVSHWRQVRPGWRDHCPRVHRAVGGRRRVRRGVADCASAAALRAWAWR